VSAYSRGLAASERTVLESPHLVSSGWRRPQMGQGDGAAASGTASISTNSRAF